ncbi:hypothetical protein SKAU_G00318120 [Synaphobranchus kaupii]|uniref:Uncharacterized protein n=1 Tax=Synaphobranchus kaupii TaxID=118154 RepID=A0A9Q1ESZ4_SYNKA|nr:hypothetical protein SKAU_G00318120 [Synaphobranchus kaupii]
MHMAYCAQEGSKPLEASVGTAGRHTGTLMEERDPARKSEEEAGDQLRVRLSQAHTTKTTPCSSLSFCPAGRKALLSECCLSAVTLRHRLPPPTSSAHASFTEPSFLDLAAIAGSVSPLSSLSANASPRGTCSAPARIDPDVRVGDISAAPGDRCSSAQPKLHHFYLPGLSTAVPTLKIPFTLIANPPTPASLPPHLLKLR